jgi:hypothetical protein
MVRSFDLANGTVVNCCMDGMGWHVIGHVATTHALKIYNGQPYRSLRGATRSCRDVAPCDSCSFL